MRPSLGSRGPPDGRGSGNRQSVCLGHSNLSKCTERAEPANFRSGGGLPGVFLRKSPNTVKVKGSTGRPWDLAGDQKFHLGTRKLAMAGRAREKAERWLSSGRWLYSRPKPGIHRPDRLPDARLLTEDEDGKMG